MSILYCERHDRRWDSDLREACPRCEDGPEKILEAPIHHEREPHCCGCWIIWRTDESLYAECNECGEKRDLLAFLAIGGKSGDAILRAIADRNLLSFVFVGQTHIVEPHAYGKTAAGDDVLRCFQVGGDSQDTFSWKLIPVSEATNFALLDQHFLAARSGYASGDRGMKTIYAELQ